VRLAAPRRIAAITIAAVVGVGTPALLLSRAPRDAALDEIARFDAAYGGLRTLLPPGAVVGLGLGGSSADPAVISADEYDRLYLAQYTFAPALFRPLRVRTCLEQGLAACGAGEITHLVLLDAPPSAVRMVAGRLDLEPVSVGPGLTLLARRGR
jgi:hypothetical protein